jgi:hypothetical protein
MSENFIDFGLKMAEKQFIARNMGGGKKILLPYTLRSTEVKIFFRKCLNLSLIIIY